jgi:hypothetical protein
MGDFLDIWTIFLTFACHEKTTVCCPEHRFVGDVLNFFKRSTCDVVPLRKKNRHYNSAEPVTSPKTNVDSNSFFGNMNANMIVFVQEKIHN